MTPKLGILFAYIISFTWLIMANYFINQKNHTVYSIVAHILTLLSGLFYAKELAESLQTLDTISVERAIFVSLFLIGASYLTSMYILKNLVQSCLDRYQRNENILEFSFTYAGFIFGIVLSNVFFVNVTFMLLGQNKFIF